MQALPNNRKNVDVAGTKFTRTGIAYELTGDGGPTLVLNWGWFSNIEAFHEIPGYTDFIERLAEFVRVVTFDVRGMGASTGPVGTFEDRVDDFRSVVDGVSHDPVIVGGASSGGALAVAFAASAPSRTEGAILYGTYSRLTSSDDQVFMASSDMIDRIRRSLGRWGNGATVGPLASSIAVASDGRELWKRIELACIDAESAVASFDVDATIDVTDRLPFVRAPALVIHRVNEQFVPPQAARFLARRIPRADLVYIDGLDHYPWLGNSQTIVTAIRDFVAGAPARPSDMKGILLTDIARSTQHTYFASAMRDGSRSSRSTTGSQPRASPRVTDNSPSRPETGSSPSSTVRRTQCAAR